MKLKLECPYAAYNERMWINCKKAEHICAHQRFCGMKGRCVLTEQAKDCPLRDKEENNGNQQK